MLDASGPPVGRITDPVAKSLLRHLVRQAQVKPALDRLAKQAQARSTFVGMGWPLEPHDRYEQQHAKQMVCSV